MATFVPAPLNPAKWAFLKFRKSLTGTPWSGAVNPGYPLNGTFCGVNNNLPGKFLNI